MSWSSLRPVEFDGVPAIEKRTTYDARLEANGLEALRAAGAPVPRVLAVDAGRLVLERVAGPGDWGELGRTLAKVHRTTADRFGYPIDNVIGSLPQPNGWRESWGRFYADHRVAIHLGDPSVPPDVADRLRAACEDRLPALLDGAHPVPSLVHGDLWAGNVVGGAWLVDPAVSHSDREVELAFMAVFGGIPEAMWRGYLEAWPLPDGWERRRPALQLHHLLVHVRLFGGGYIDDVRLRLDALRW